YQLPPNQQGRRARCHCGLIFTVEPLFELPDTAASPVEPPLRNPADVDRPLTDQVQRDRDHSPAADIGQRLRQDWRLGLMLTWASLVCVPVSLVPVSSSTWFSASGVPGEPAQSIGTFGVAAGILLMVFGLFFFARSKGQSALWSLAGVLWGVGAVVVHHLPDRRRVARLTSGQASALAQFIGLEESYRNLPWFRRHRVHGTLVTTGLVSVGLMLWLRVLSGEAEPMAARALLGLSEGWLLGALFVGPTLVTMLTGEIYQPPRPSDERLRPWGPTRRLALIIGLVLWLLAVAVLALGPGSATTTQGSNSNPIHSPRDVAEAVERAMYERWNAMARLAGQRDHGKHVVRVEIDGFDPDTGVWVGRIESDQRGRRITREFEVEVIRNRVNLEVYDSPRMGETRSIHDLKREGQFVPSSVVLDRGPP
ncbi:MAG: hypothetical protein AAGA25_17750, partial [Planctomycetota bacterium]